MIKLRHTLIGAVLAVHYALPALAQPGAAVVAASTEDLLRQVEQANQEQDRQFQEAVDRYNAAPAAQQNQMLQDAQRQRDQLNATSEGLSDDYSANELRVNELDRELREKATTLGLTELFGLARQTANDAASVLQQSLITTQFPTAAGEQPRDEFLRAFAAGRATPTSEELERLWVEIQREMTASGQIVKYQARVIQPGGAPVDAEVVRIGPFTAMSDGQFLSYLPELRALNVLPRQLPEEFMDVARRFESATSGYVQAIVDPFRGVTLGLYMERPTLGERVELGEEIGYIIIAVGVAGVLAFLYQLVSLVLVRMAVSRQLKDRENPSPNNPLGRVLLAFRGDKNRIEEEADVAELRITEAVLREVPKLERFQAFLRLAVAAGPLLGLIGTVWGMILTFQTITETGQSDPRLMATGIGQAMIATVLGLGIAIPLLFANALLNSLSRSLVQTLDEQSAGMLAESIEKQRRA